jgi:transcription initiation factor TFIIIB Brf1 subunit/transcription initiation factor TFIIB
VKNRSSNLNRARPNSIASAIIYYWITKKNINITLKEFAKKTNLSEITISKISKEISTILKKLEKGK